jgi:hypothetical protein
VTFNYEVRETALNKDGEKVKVDNKAVGEFRALFKREANKMQILMNICEGVIVSLF